MVVVLIDDIGFGASSTFGGPINMPNLEKIAATGLKYNRFHTTSLCSPTRVALLTGYNHHSNNAGSIMETATAFPGNNGVRPQSITPMAEVLRQNGFSTAALRQVSRNTALGNLVRWAIRSLAHAFRVRKLLRIYWWRNEPICAVGLRRNRAGRTS